MQDSSQLREFLFSSNIQQRNEALNSLIGMLSSNESEEQLEAVRLLSHAAVGDAEIQNAIRRAHGLPAIMDLTAHPNNLIRNEALWALFALTQNNPLNKETLRNLNAIPRLEPLLREADPIVSSSINILLHELQTAQAFAVSQSPNVSSSSNQPNH
ncbi:MAG: Spinocerebellar ataxia type 10 protein domain [Gammaproteobacteria bacterium]|jgi:hypothetical protein|nr:Spinocerebellar ataxia type 10 protein domain [Gammaproteobacteria bacterium]